ncbi:molybdenum cofactor guanylyltransferase [Olleya sp. HaHaR_3_96]|uniref:molybdenum cofactor guanylyltransferase n=1 Tax=Olleya sp. HaHaR_3_96 TaxID=2745560 RepID=UPI001C4F8FE4|nr:molybdenum cofactor guanylyltransferase [Olleya sp. HaHaR_3_96]QXP59364.1 molybdenum cofactor guanylyltransferase [Olleya sp. HaHaR_3_96]
MLDRTNITGIILAGGKSQRMGTDKGLILLHNSPFIKHISIALKPLVSEIIIVSNIQKHDIFGFKRIEDDIENAGPVAGIYSGLKASKTDYNLVLSCDIPLINTTILRQLISNIENDVDIVQIKSKGQTMPLIALYKKQCESIFYKLLLEGERRLKIAVNSCTVKTINLDKNLEDYTANINTPEQLKKISNDNNH